MGGVMLSELECGRCGFQTRSGQTKDYEIGICYFSPKHETVRRTSKDVFFKGISREIKTSIGMFYQYVYIDGQHINIANLRVTVFFALEIRTSRHTRILTILKILMLIPLFAKFVLSKRLILLFFNF